MNGKDKPELVNSSFLPDVLNKIALSEDRIRRSSKKNIFGCFKILWKVSNAIHQENGELLFTTWYDKGFTEESQFSTYTDAQSNLLSYVEEIWE